MSVSKTIDGTAPLSAVFDRPISTAPPQRTLELDSTLDRAFSVSQLERARAAWARNDMTAFAAACHRWLQETCGIELGDGVLVLGRRQQVELRVEDFALGWDDGADLMEPRLWFYGLTLQLDGQRVARQWNSVRHDAGLAKVAQHSDALARHIATSSTANACDV